MANKSNDLAHRKWMCKYHIVFTPKYMVCILQRRSIRIVVDPGLVRIFYR